MTDCGSVCAVRRERGTQHTTKAGVPTKTTSRGRAYPCTQRAPGLCAPARLVGPLAPVLDVSEQLRRVGPHQLALALGTGQLAVLHEVKGWHGAHLGARGDVRALVDIHLDEGGLGKVCCELLVDRLDLLARSTPAEARGEGGRSVGGARDGAAGVAAPRVDVASQRAVRAAVLMVAVAVAEVEVATVVRWRRRCSWVCTGGAPARGEVDDAQALGGECLAILRVVGDLDHTSALAARAERPHGGRRRRYWRGQGERTHGARGSHDGGAPDAGGSSAPNEGRRSRGADEASGASGEHHESSADGTRVTAGWRRVGEVPSPSAQTLEYSRLCISGREG